MCCAHHLVTWTPPPPPQHYFVSSSWKEPCQSINGKYSEERLLHFTHFFLRLRTTWFLAPFSFHDPIGKLVVVWLLWLCSCRDVSDVTTLLRITGSILLGLNLFLSVYSVQCKLGFARTISYDNLWWAIEDKFSLPNASDSEYVSHIYYTTSSGKL